MNREQARVADWRQRAGLPAKTRRLTHLERMRLRREQHDADIEEWRRRIGYPPLKG